MTKGDRCLRIDNVCDGEDTCKVNPNRGIKGPKVKNELHAVKIPRLLLPCQVFVALQKSLLSIFHWYSNPNSCTNIYIHRTILYHFISYSEWSAKPIGYMNCFWEVALNV